MNNTRNNWIGAAVSAVVLVGVLSRCSSNRDACSSAGAKKAVSDVIARKVGNLEDLANAGSALMTGAANAFGGTQRRVPLYKFSFDISNWTTKVMNDHAADCSAVVTLTSTNHGIATDDHIVRVIPYTMTKDDAGAWSVEVDDSGLLN